MYPSLSPILKLVFATRNRNKLAELTALLAGTGIVATGLDEYPDAPEVEETGATFEANAILKAEAIRDALGLPALADDSGLCVDALGGAPGVLSARYAGPDADDAANNALVLANMAGRGDRGCGFVCVLAWAVPGAATRCYRGETRGRLLESAAGGGGGFGYDPLFLSDDLGVAFSRASREEKGGVSHRGRALRSWLADMTRKG